MLLLHSVWQKDSRNMLNHKNIHEKSNNEKMSIPFYVGALIIIATVLANGFLKSYEAKKRKHSVK